MLSDQHQANILLITHHLPWKLNHTSSFIFTSTTLSAHIPLQALDHLTRCSKDTEVSSPRHTLPFCRAKSQHHLRHTSLTHFNSLIIITINKVPLTTPSWLTLLFARLSLMFDVCFLPELLPSGEAQKEKEWGWEYGRLMGVEGTTTKKETTTKKNTPQPLSLFSYFLSITQVTTGKSRNTQRHNLTRVHENNFHYTLQTWKFHCKREVDNFACQRIFIKVL